MDRFEKLSRLKTIIGELGSAVVAFSGGVDSSFLLYIAQDVLKEKCVAVSLKSSFQASGEQANRDKILSLLSSESILIEGDFQWELPEVVDNNPERCYYCKKAIFLRIREEAERLSIQHVLDGSNADDVHDYRPGMRALKELGVRSPLMEAGLTKEEIRQFSKEFDLLTWDAPSMACLASRIPYNTPLTKENIKKVSCIEDILIENGYTGGRARLHGDILRIELPNEKMKNFLENKKLPLLVEEIKALGVDFVTMDLEGFISGKMNRQLSLEREEENKHETG